MGNDASGVSPGISPSRLELSMMLVLTRVGIAGEYEPRLSETIYANQHRLQ